MEKFENWDVASGKQFIRVDCSRLKNDLRAEIFDIIKTIIIRTDNIKVDRMIPIERHRRKNYKSRKNLNDENDIYIKAISAR